MTILKFLFINTIAVLLMTLFSYIISLFYKANFSEPYLLKYLVNHSKFINKSNFGLWIGWCLHFTIGLVFLCGYFLLKNSIPVDSELVYALGFGCIAGVCGVLGWELMFSIHQNPPKLPKLLYYIQLIGAHIVFSLTAAAMWLVLK
ncbi:hypothetical protein FNB79_15000 [Formosa sediminum]|uniref:DUF2938 domain-containing protein n=1 Tax=Formosa sediminum TaxID=2594004 RepID=A0A516GUM4_9FLAO|nr:hypothetical protein [Formosa sediminum]QDO95224.1 hypothetical protein FNB79_15000 [Formosa sediminum]